MKKRLIVIGASDLIEIATASCPGHEIAGYADLEARSGGGVPYLGTDDDVLADGGLADADFAVAIGDNGRRRRLVERLRRAGRQVVTVVHPSATVFASARLGEGVVVCPQAVVSADAVVGASSMVTYAAVVGHGVGTGAYCFLAPGAKLLGGVSLGDEVVVGANAVILPGLSVGHRSRISAGTVVTRPVPERTVVLLRQQTRNLSLEEE